MAILSKGARITGVNRTKLATDLKKKYTKGASIRELADENGRSYGFIHRVLAESGVQLRSRGGATRTKVTSTRGAAAPSAAHATKTPTSRPAKGKAATATRTPKPAPRKTAKSTAPGRKVDSRKAASRKA